VEGVNAVGGETRRRSQLVDSANTFYYFSSSSNVDGAYLYSCWVQDRMVGKKGNVPAVKGV